MCFSSKFKTKKGVGPILRMVENILHQYMGYVHAAKDFLAEASWCQNLGTFYPALTGLWLRISLVQQGQGH